MNDLYESNMFRSDDKIWFKFYVTSNNNKGYVYKIYVFYVQLYLNMTFASYCYAIDSDYASIPCFAISLKEVILSQNEHFTLPSSPFFFIFILHKMLHFPSYMIHLQLQLNLFQFSYHFYFLSLIIHLLLLIEAHKYYFYFLSLTWLFPLKKTIYTSKIDNW